MIRLSLPLLVTALFLTACGDGTDRPDMAEDNDRSTQTEQQDAMTAREVMVHPVYHGSLVLMYAGMTIYVDPHGGAQRYTQYGAPDLVLITHTHGDHMDTATLNGLDLAAASLVAPAAVTEALGDGMFTSAHVLANGESYTWEDIDISAVPAYNPPPKENFHPQGQFNGYVLDLGGERVYVSGDTEGVPAMRQLDSINVAFVCMNLPYTMDVNQAADAVLAFAPDVIYPYHYRNQDGSFSDVEEFQRIVKAGNGDIEVRLEDWYDGGE